MIRLKHGASHTPPFNGEVKNYWKCTATTALCIDGWILDQFSVMIYLIQRKYCDMCYSLAEELELYEVFACFWQVVVEKSLLTCIVL
jgi:hypothetical protein